MSTLLDLKNQALLLLGQNANTPAGNLETGTGSAPTLTTADTLLYFINQAADDIAQTCLPIGGSGTVAAVAGTASYAFSGLTVSGIGGLWRARAVMYNGVGIPYLNRVVLEVNFPTWETDASGTPLYWSQAGRRAVMLYPAPSGTSTITVHGFATPTYLAADGDIPSWLPLQYHQMLAYYAAYSIAMKQATQDPALGEMAPLWRREYDQARLELWGEIDPLTRRGYFPNPPMGVSPVAKAAA